MKRKASIATAAVFLAVLFGFSLLHLALPDREVSRSERRRLAQLPPLSSGFSDKLEEYMLDQFPLREQLRTVNSLVRLYGLGQADIHSIYLQGGGAFRMDGPLQEKQVRHAAAVFSAVRETYFPSLPSHYVIVPDKNAKAETSRPRLDTEALRGIVREALPGMTEIEIWDLLSADDYYKTDHHWRQERLLPVAAAICEALGADGVQCVGSKFVIYRRSEKKAQEAARQARELKKRKSNPVRRGAQERRRQAREERERRNEYFRQAAIQAAIERRKSREE